MFLEQNLMNMFFSRDQYREKIRKQARSQMMQRFESIEQKIGTPSVLIFEDQQQIQIETEISSTNENHVESSPTYEMNAEISNVLPETKSPQTPSHYFNGKHQKLANWAVTNNQSRKSVNSLLEILREEDRLLPKDYRTLCSTPKKVHSQIEDMGSGKYIHFGLVTCLKQFLTVNDVKTLRLLLDMNIDGVPISKSSSSCL